MSHSDPSYDDPEDRAEAERLRELYSSRVQQVRRQLEPWQGGRAVTVSYGHMQTNSPFTGVPGNSVLEVQLFKDGGEGTARLRCIACWRVTFLTFWTGIRIQIDYQDGGLVKLLVSDGERLRVECTDVEVVEGTPLIC
jgi:hypothetical protein